MTRLETTAAEFCARLGSTLADWGVEGHGSAPVQIDLPSGDAWVDLPHMTVELTAGATGWPKKIADAYKDEA